MPEDAGSIYSSIFLKLDELQKGVLKVHQTLDGMSKKTEKQSKGFAGFWKNAFQTAFGFGIVQIINKVTAAIKNAVMIFAGFQQSMQNVKSVTGAVGQEFDMMTEAAKEAGETTRFTAREAADALYYLGSAGFTAEQSISALDGVLQLAGATQADLASTAEALASIISQYGLQAEDAGRVSNVFAAAIGNSQATMEKLTNSFRQVGPVAAGFGYTVEETTGALQELYNAGFQGQMAGRALKSALADLASPTANMEKIFSKLGISMDKVNPATTEFADIIDILAQSGADTADIIDAFGKIAGPQMAVLIRQGGDALRRYTEDVTDTNAAAEMYKIQNDSLAGSMDFLKSKLEGTAIAIFEKLEPGMRDLIDSFIAFLDSTKPLGEALGYVFNILFKIAGFSTGVLGKFFDVLLGGFKKLKSPMKEITTSFDAVRDSIKKAGDIEKTTNKLSKLTEEYENLSSKTNLTKDQQNRLREVITQIEKIVPDAVTKFDAYGNAIEISGEKSREAAKQMLVARKAMLSQAKASLDVVKPQLETMLKLQGEQLRVLKEEEKKYAEVNRVAEGRFSILTEMKNVFSELLEEEVRYGTGSVGSFSRAQEGILRYQKRLQSLGLTQFNVFAKGKVDITKVLDEIGNAINKTQSGFEAYQKALKKRIDIEIGVQDIKSKLNELVELENELKVINKELKNLGDTTEKEDEKITEFVDASTEFWNNYRSQIEKATREASLFSDKQDKLKASLDFLKTSYLELLEQGLDPASETMTRLRAEYDLTLMELNALIEAEKKQADELQNREKAEKDIIETTLEYTNKLEELGKTENELIEIERERALASILASDATMEAIQRAYVAVNEYFDKLKENSEETKEDLKITFDEILSYAQDLANALIGLWDSVTQNRLDNLDKELEAELEQAGLLEETERERLERELEEAIENGDKKTAEELQDQLDRLDIEEEYEKKKALLEYKAAMVEWKLKLAAAIANAAQAVLNALATPPFPLGLALSIIAGTLGGIQIATVVNQKPVKPTFASGGLFLGPETDSGTNATLHPPEMILNQDQMANLFNAIDNNDLDNNSGGGNTEITVIIELEGTPIYKGVETAQQNGTIRFKASRLI